MIVRAVGDEGSLLVRPIQIGGGPAWSRRLAKNGRNSSVELGERPIGSGTMKLWRPGRRRCSGNVWWLAAVSGCCMAGRYGCGMVIGKEWREGFSDRLT